MADNASAYITYHAWSADPWNGCNGGVIATIHFRATALGTAYIVIIVGVIIFASFNA